MIIIKFFPDSNCGCDLPNYGKDFIITMAPVGSSLMYDLPGLSGFVYKNLLLVKGGIPGAPDGSVVIKRSVKNQTNAGAA